MVGVFTVISLEPITGQNAMVFKDVRLCALQDTPSAFGSTYAKESLFSHKDWVKRAAQWTSEISVAYIAMDDGTPCGIVGGFIDKDDATIAHLVSMWVAPSHRRQGVGQFLVSAIFDWAQTRGAHTLLLTVTCNNTPAIKFYEHLGFAMTGRTEPYPNDPALVEYEMSRTI
jgi:ribosomal protein S18 acetylase RimI-like enzyme